MSERRDASQALPEVPWRTPTQAAAIIGMGVIVAIIIGALYLAQATVTATTGSELFELQRTQDFLQRANSDTVAQIALKRSIGTLRGRAQALGFRAAGPDEQHFIVVEGYSPNRATPTPQPTAVPTYVYNESFTGWLEQQWNQLVRQFEQWMRR